MNIVHLSCVAPPQIGGIGRVASLEVESLRERGIDASLLSPATVPTYWSFGNAAALRVKQLKAAVQDADVVHLHYPFYGTAGIVARLRRKKIIKRLVVTLHMDATANGWKGFLFRLHRKYLQSNLLSCADALLVSSKDYARASSFAEVAEQTIELPFGTDEKRFSPAPANRAAYGVPSDAPVVVFVGGMDKAHAFKGIEVLLKAFVELPMNTWLVLGGDGDLRSQYETLAKEFGVTDRVKFLGYIPSASLPNVYRLGDVYAFPSRSSAEAFGLVALEAQACGIPVVASDLPGVRTVIEDKVTGFLTPPDDARELAAHLRLLLENEGMRKEFGEAARARVLQKFTWTKHMDALIEVYQKICGSPS